MLKLNPALELRAAFLFIPQVTVSQNVLFPLSNFHDGLNLPGLWGLFLLAVKVFFILWNGGAVLIFVIGRSREIPFSFYFAGACPKGNYH
jgi:hypothetical protein